MSAPVTAVDLRVERTTDPLGIADAHPLLSWRLAGPTTDRQTGFRIRVVTGDADPRESDGGMLVWDSGELTGWASTDVPYAGPPLTARTRYRWSVRPRVGDDPGAWAEPAEFEMALTDTDGLAASWITAADELDAPVLPPLDPNRFTPTITRIWLPGGTQPGSAAVFETTLTVPAGAAVVGSQLLAVGAGTIHAFVNDMPVGCDGRFDATAATAWRQGPNRLRIEAAAEPDETPGLLASGLVVLRTGEPLRIGSDDGWRVRPGGANGEQRGERSGADHWRLAQGYGANGDAPRGREVASHRPSPYLRRSFTVASPVARARLYATALGVYQAALNGTRVGRHELAPGWTDYHKRLPYQTYDVTDAIVTGENVLSAVLGDGWYAGHVGWLGPFRYGNARMFAARLEIEHTDGTRTVVTTDGDWRTGTGAIRYSDQQNGEVVQPSATEAGYDRPGFDDAGWQPARVAQPRHGRLEAEVNPPIAVEHTIAPARITRRDDGRILIDFGQNLVGRVRLRLPAAAIAADTTLIVAHAEVLDDRGELYVEALRSARCTDQFELTPADGGEDGRIELAPTFSWRGFRYAELTGYPGELTVEHVQAEVLQAAMTQIGQFACSNPYLTKLQANIVWGQRGNFLSVPTDCPQRDERLGWTGDAQAFASTAAFNYDVRGFFRKWLRDLRDAQGGNGAVSHVAPDPLSPAEPGYSAQAPSQAGSAGWGDAVVIVPAALYWTYGDARVVHESLDAIGAWLAYLEATSVGGIRGVVDGIGPADGFGDWLAITPTPKDLISTAFVAYAAKLAAELAAELGDPARVSEWSALYERTRQAFRARWVRGGGRVVPGTQTAYVLALHVELLHPDEEPAAVQRLVRDIASRNDHLASGFLGTAYLLQVLTKHGRADVAFTLLTQDSYPSWLYPVVHGDATTMWERWDSWSDSRGFQDPGMTSFNHYAYGCVGEWLYRAVAGLTPGTPGYGHSVIKPHVGGGLTWAEGSLDTVHGRLATRWDLANGTLSLRVTVPPNATAEVWLPQPDGGHGDHPEQVEAGEHEFEVAGWPR